MLAAPAFGGDRGGSARRRRGHPRQRARLSIVRALQGLRRPVAGIRRAAAGAQRARSARWRCVPSATTSRRSPPRCGARAAAASRTTCVIITVDARRAGDRRQGRREGHRARRDRPVFTNITNDLPIQTGDRLSHSSYEVAQGRAAARRRHLRLSRRAHGAQRDARRPAGAHRRRRHRVRDRRALPASARPRITQDAIDEPLARRYLRYQENEPFNATELLRTQFALDDSLYFSTVEVLPEERDRENHTVPVSIVAEPNRRHRVPVRRRLRHRHPGARHHRLGRPARQHRRSPLPHGNPRRGAGAVAGCALHRAHRRPGHRKIHAAADRRTRAARRHRRPDTSTSRRASPTCAAPGSAITTGSA